MKAFSFHLPIDSERIWFFASSRKTCHKKHREKGLKTQEHLLHWQDLLTSFHLDLLMKAPEAQPRRSKELLQLPRASYTTYGLHFESHRLLLIRSLAIGTALPPATVVLRIVVFGYLSRSKRLGAVMESLKAHKKKKKHDTPAKQERINSTSACRLPKTNFLAFQQSFKGLSQHHPKTKQTSGPNINPPPKK